MINHKYEIFRLSRIKDFSKIYNDWYFQEYFVKKYISDLPRMAFEVFGTKLTFQQMDIWNTFIKSGGWKGGRLCVPSGHGCHGIDTPIMLHNGTIKKVQDVTLQDKLMGDDGKPRVIEALARGKEELFEIEYSNGIKRVYNKSHILVLKHIVQGRTIEIKISDYLQTSNEFKSIFVPFLKEQGNFNISIMIEIKKIKSLGVGNYYGFTIGDNHRYLDGDFIVTRNTGKTFSIGLYATAHLLLFENSITRIQAPTLQQVKTSSFKEISNNINGLKKRHKISDDLIIEPKWKFLADLIQINKEVIYIKGYDTSWYIEAKTAPKGDSTNISGQHNLNYLLIIDEASGVEDEHIEAGLGAMSEEFNSCIMFSQHTKLSGKFHDFCTIKSVEYGGVWHKIRLSSRYSPRVSRKQLKNWLDTYSEEEVRVRVDGLPPKKEIGTLLSSEEAENIYHNKFKNINFNTIGFSIDFGFSGYRDSSIITVFEATSVLDEIVEKEYIYANVLDIMKYDGVNGYKPVEFAEKIVFKEILNYLNEAYENGATYNSIKIIGDANTSGDEAMGRLEDLLLGSQTFNFDTIKLLKWGSEKLYFGDKQRFVNARAKGYVYLKEAVLSHRFGSIEKFRTRTLKELGNLYYTFTKDTYKYKMLSKDELIKKGLSSPDIADTFAQIFLLTYDTTFADMINQVDDNIEYSSDEDLDIELTDYDDIEDECFIQPLQYNDEKTTKYDISTISIDDI